MADIPLVFTAVNRTRATFARVNKDMEKLNQSTKRTNRGFRAIDAVFASIAAGSLIAWSKSILNVASNMEKARLQVALFTGSFDAAKGTIADLRKQFQGLPIETETMVKGFVRFKSVGIDPMNGSLKALTSAILAMGGGTDEINRATVAISQMASKGVVNMEDLKQQLAESLPGAIKFFADATGRTMPEFIKAVSSGKVPASELLFLFEELEKKFGRFGELLANTIAGGETAILKSFKDDVIDRVFGNFGLDTRIGIFLNAIAKQISAFGKSITEADVERFVEFLKNVIRFGAGAALAVARMAKIVLGLVDVFLSVFSTAGADILISGFIGRILFGSKGIGMAFGLIAILDRLKENIEKTGSEGLKRVVALGSDIALYGLLGRLLFGKLGLLVTVTAILLNNLWQQVRQSEIFKTFMEVVSGEGPGFRMSAAEQARVREMTAGGMTGREAREVIAQEKAAARAAAESNDTKSQAVGIFQQALEAARDAMSFLTIETDKNVESGLAATDNYKAVKDTIDSVIKSLNLQVDALGDQAASQDSVNKATREAISLQIKATQAQMRTNRIRDQVSDIKASFGAQFLTNSAFDDAKAKAREYRDLVLNTQIDILKVQKEMAREGVTEDQLKDFQGQIAALKELQAVAQQAAESVTASGIQMRDTWRSLGEIISDTAKTGLADLAKGTLEVETLLRNMFNSITDLAADFLIELAKIKLLQAAAGTAGGGGTGGGGAGTAGMFASIAGALFGGGFARGGFFPSGTSMSPGLVSGPQLFSAGEKGAPEAIIPLTQLRQMMGNQSMNETHITIQAIDTQAAAEVMLANAEVMNQGLLGGQNLNIRTV